MKANALELKKPKKWTKTKLFKALNDLESYSNGTVWFTRQKNKIYIFIRQTSSHPNDGLLFAQGQALTDFFTGICQESSGFDKQSSQYMITLVPKFKFNN